MGILSFYELGNSCTNVWEDFSSYLEENAEVDCGSYFTIYAYIHMSNVTLCVLNMHDIYLSIIPQ